MACKIRNTLSGLVFCAVFGGIVLAFVLGIAANESAASPEKTKAGTEKQEQESISRQQDYPIGPGDVLRIIVFDEAELSGEYAVDGEGRITFPLTGQVQVTGLSPYDISEKLSELLEKGFLVDPRINVEIVRFRPFYVLGEVRRPGSYDYVEGLTVLNAVALSGGFTYRARRSEVSILRKQKDGTSIALEVDTGTRIMPGDVIEIRERFF